MNKEEIMNQVCDCFKMNITLNELEKIIENLQKKAELGEHYKHLYSEVKKQKDDVVKYLDKIEKMTDYEFRNEYWMQNILRMLGEIDVED